MHGNIEGCNNNKNRKKWSTGKHRFFMILSLYSSYSFARLKKSYNSISSLKCSGVQPIHYMRLHRKMYYKCIRYRKRNAVNSLRIFLSAWTVNVYIAFRRFFFTIMLFQNRGENCKIIIIYCVAKKRQVMRAEITTKIFFNAKLLFHVQGVSVVKVDVKMYFYAKQSRIS